MLPDDPDWERVSAAVDAAAEQLSLICSMRGTLRSCPGCTHWHFKLPNTPGTIEVTAWPKGFRLWIKLQDRRATSSIASLATALAAQITQSLNRPVTRRTS